MRRVLASLLLVGCTLGVRAEGAFEAEQPLGDAGAVLVDLPSTPVRVLGCDAQTPASCPDAVRIAGRWHAVGGSSEEARRNASSPSLRFESGAGLMRVSAQVPLSVEGLVDLELDEVALPSAVDLEVRTSLGDVTLEGMSSVVLVEVEVGDVDIRGAMRSTGVHVDEGQVYVRGPGPMDVHDESGGVRIEQTASAADTRVRAPGGDVELILGDDLDVDLRVSTPGHIRVATDAFAAVTRGLYRARSGDGSTRVDIEAGGDVTVRLRTP